MYDRRFVASIPVVARSRGACELVPSGALVVAGLASTAPCQPVTRVADRCHDSTTVTVRNRLSLFGLR